MPATRHALHVTDTYRRRTGLLRDHAQTLVRVAWSVITPDDLDASHAAWRARVTPALVELQRAGARLSAAYLTAYLIAELRRPVPPPAVTVTGIGASRAGKPLPDALVTSLIATKVAIGDGHPVQAALAIGLDRATRNAGEDVMNTTRTTLDQGIQTDDRVIGWRRVTGGGCGACIAAATGAIQAEEEVLLVHDNCQCTKEPVVADVPDQVQRPTGGDMFDSLTTSEQNQLLGPEKAHLVRSGDVPLHALIDHTPMRVLPDQITERPLDALKAQEA